MTTLPSLLQCPHGTDPVWGEYVDCFHKDERFVVMTGSRYGAMTFIDYSDGEVTEWAFFDHEAANFSRSQVMQFWRDQMKRCILGDLPRASDGVALLRGGVIASD